MRYTFYQNGAPAGFSLKNAGETAWTEYYFVKNLQGDVLKVYKAADNSLAAAYTYEPFGKIRTSTGEMAAENPFRYRGYSYDAETGFYYLQSRYYDPIICRFINADSYASTGQGFVGYNMFAYCMNNPMNMSDHRGNWPKWLENTVKVVSVVIVVAAVVATVAAVTAFTAGTGSAAAVYVSSIVLGAALSGINSAIANEAKGNSYANGYGGGFISGATQSAASRLPGGTVWGGALGTSAGTALTMGLNNLDPDSSNSTASEIVTEVKNSAIKATVTSSITASISSGVGGIDYNTGALYGSVADECGGLLPSLTLGFGEGIKAVFGAIDDALVYIWE